MAEKAIAASHVQLRQPCAIDAQGHTGFHWSSDKVQCLTYYPDTKQASCVIRGKTYMADTAWACVDEQGLKTWQDDGLSCEVCGQSFESKQALGSHRLSHQAKAVKR